MGIGIREVYVLEKEMNGFDDGVWIWIEVFWLRGVDLNI